MNLNQIKNYLKKWFESNPFLNTVIVSTKDDYTAVRDVNYPVAHIEYVNNQTNSNYNNYVFSISIADIQNQKLEHYNTDEIQNNCQLIAQDFIDFHSENIDVFEMDENVSINIFEEENPDRTAGVTFAVRLAVHRDINVCTLPNLAFDGINTDFPESIYNTPHRHNIEDVNDLPESLLSIDNSITDLINDVEDIKNNTSIELPVHTHNIDDINGLDARLTAIENKKFKTINNQSILGDGNIEISGGGTDVSTLIKVDKDKGTYVQHTNGNAYVGGGSETVISGSKIKLDFRGLPTAGEKKMTIDSNGYISFADDTANDTLSPFKPATIYSEYTFNSDVTISNLNVLNNIRINASNISVTELAQTNSGVLSINNWGNVNSDSYPTAIIKGLQKATAEELNQIKTLLGI